MVVVRFDVPCIETAIVRGVMKFGGSGSSAWVLVRSGGCSNDSGGSILLVWTIVSLSTT